MNQDRIAGLWKRFAGSAREFWGKLTHDPLLEDAGAREKRAGQSRERYGISREQCERQLNDFRDRNREWNVSDLQRPRLKMRPAAGGRANATYRIRARPQASDGHSRG